MNKFKKYTENLGYDSSFIYSYGTKVAEIDNRNKTAKKLGYWSATTSKHINYACNELGLKLL